MNKEDIREYCLSKPAATEGLPFNDTALVFKVMNKMFAVLDLSEQERGLTLKCDPERAIQLREEHAEVTPAWHFNKENWNGIDIRGGIGRRELEQWIDHSYDLIVSSLPKKLQAELKRYE